MSLAQAPLLGGRDQIGNQWSANNCGRVSEESSLSSRVSESCEEVGLTPGHSEVKPMRYQLLSLVFRWRWKQRQRARAGGEVDAMCYQEIVLCWGLCQAFLQIISFRPPEVLGCRDYYH